MVPTLRNVFIVAFSTKAQSLAARAAYEPFVQFVSTPERSLGAWEVHMHFPSTGTITHSEKAFVKSILDLYSGWFLGWYVEERSD